MLELDELKAQLKTYEEPMRMLEVYRKLSAAEAQIEEEKVLLAEDSVKGLRERYGL